MLNQWRLYSVILTGVIVAIALLSSAPLYSNAINDLGLEHSLQNKAIELLDLNFYAPNYYIDGDEFEEASGLISEKITKNLDKIIRQDESWIQTQYFDFFYTDRPTPGGPYQPTGYIQSYTNLDKHIKIVDGELAEYVEPAFSQEDIVSSEYAIEGMIGSETAEILNVCVGDRVILRSGFGGTVQDIHIVLSALIDPVDPKDEFWFLNTQVFTLPLVDSEGNSIPPRAPIFIPEETLFNILPLYFPAARASYNWLYYVDIDKVRSDNAESIKNDIRRIEREILQDLPRSGLFTTLDGLIAAYSGRLVFTQIPLFVIIFQVAAILLFYLMMVSNMVVEQQAGEISMYRSRGAGTWHIFLIYLTEGLLISVIGTVIGAFLGAFLFSLLGKTDSLQSLTGGQMIPVRFSGTVILFTVSGAVLCLFAMLFPAMQASRRGIVRQKQAASRPSSTPFWQRFYLDIVLLVAGIALYWELEARGSLVNMDIFGGLGIDPLILLTPVLIILAVAIVFLRLFPLLARLATRLTQFFGNVWAALGLWWIARNSIRYTRLIMLLVVAISVGMFSSTFIGSLEQNYNERNVYIAGGDLRLESLNESHSSKEVLEERYSEIEGVEGVGVVYRQPGNVGTTYSSAEFELLAVDTEQTKNIAWFRKDFDEKPLFELMDLLGEDRPRDEGLIIPETAETIGLWVYTGNEDIRATVYARIKDGKGRYMDVNLGGIGPEDGEWMFLQGKLTVAGSAEFLPPPCSLSSLYIRTQPDTVSNIVFREIYFDDLQLDGASFSEPLILEDFDDVSEWQVSPDESSMKSAEIETQSGSFDPDTYTVYNGNSSARLRWNLHDADSIAVYPSPDDRPVQVLASRSFAESTGIREGMVARIRLSTYDIYITVAEIIDYFPTLDPESKGFIIADIDRLFNARNRQPGPVVYPNEVWLDLTENNELRSSVLGNIEGTLLSAKNIYEKDAMIADMKDDPLAGAAWNGILLITLLGVLLVSSLGFIVYSYLAAKQKRLDFAILKAIGLSHRQIVSLVCFEQLVIIITGIVIGTVTGDRLSHIMLPFLQLTEQGARVLPPFILTIDWGMIGLVYGILLVSFIVTGAMLVLFLSRISISDTLRVIDM